MQTIGIGLENLCVPCRANCSYCLLSSCRKATGIDYARGKALARRLQKEIKAQRPDLSFTYYIGYCMDTPDLWDYIRSCREMNMPSKDFLQFNGLRIRNHQETGALVHQVKDAGIRVIDLTFYGTKDTHDAFAGRAGDFDFLLRILAAAQKAGLAVQISIALYQSNQHQMDALLAQLSAYFPQGIRIFLPHTKGRGWALRNDRLTKADFDSLSDSAKVHFSSVPHLTEQEWLQKEEWEQPQKRILTLCPAPQDIDVLEKMSLSQIISFLEEKDNAFLIRMPSMQELSRLYGDSKNQQLFRLRDLHLLWQQMYLRDHPDLYDMHDESHHFSIHL